MHPLPFFLTEPGSGSGGSSGATAATGTNGSSPGSIRQQLDAAAAEAAARGIPVRGLLITNPNNPLGTIYGSETISEMLRWCLDNQVHYIRCGGGRPRKEVMRAACIQHMPVWTMLRGGSRGMRL